MTILAKQLVTHDAEFTRGYELGYVTARCESRSDFACDVLSSQVEPLCQALANAGARVELGEPETRRYSVSWTPIRVEFR